MRAFAYRNGPEPSSMSRLEKGLGEPKYLSLLQIAKSLKMDLTLETKSN